MVKPSPAINENVPSLPRRRTIFQSCIEHESHESGEGKGCEGFTRSRLAGYSSPLTDTLMPYNAPQYCPRYWAPILWHCFFFYYCGYWARQQCFPLLCERLVEKFCGSKSNEIINKHNEKKKKLSICLLFRMV